MRPLPIIAHQKRAARLQPPVEMHDRNAPPIGTRRDAIAGLKDETADIHPAILRHWCRCGTLTSGLSADERKSRGMHGALR